MTSATTNGRFRWIKGHGTRNDFVLLPDPDGQIHGDLDAELVRKLCDRRAGIGADGVIRVIRSASLPAGQQVSGDAEWFMDYRNSDGSVAEMCGNGVRVLARFLWDEGWSNEDPLAIGTRGGVRLVHRGPDGSSTVEMGRPVGSRLRVAPKVRVGDQQWQATAAFIPNPHAVVFVEDLADAGPLLEPPTLIPPAVFPDGANVEFVVRRGPQHVAMRVFERGVGETQSCGTGVAAVAWVAMQHDGASSDTPYRVDVPGGTLSVVLRAEGQLLLTGPAELGPRGELDPAWLG